MSHALSGQQDDGEGDGVFNRIRAHREFREAQQIGNEMLQRVLELPLPDYLATAGAPTPTAPDGTVAAAEVADFLPSDLRLPTQDEIAGMLMRYDQPLVIDGEVRTCPQCGAYRNWVILSVRDEVRLHCRAGHETLEPALDTAWYNRNSGPMDQWHPTLEDGLKHLGH
jgi:hypothetical protein